MITFGRFAGGYFYEYEIAEEKVDKNIHLC